MRHLPKKGLNKFLFIRNYSDKSEGLPRREIGKPTINKDISLFDELDPIQRKDAYQVEEFSKSTDQSMAVAVAVGEIVLKKKNKSDLPNWQFLAKAFRDELFNSVIDIKDDPVSEDAYKHYVGLFLRSAVYNLRTKKTIREDLEKAGSKVVAWWQSLPLKE